MKTRDKIITVEWQTPDKLLGVVVYRENGAEFPIGRLIGRHYLPKMKTYKSWQPYFVTQEGNLEELTQIPTNFSNCIALVFWNAVSCHRILVEEKVMPQNS